MLENKSQLPKVMILRHAMHRAEVCSIPDGKLPEFESIFKPQVGDIYRLLASDYDKQTREKDPVLYPGLMPMECLKKLPPTIICTCEFDFLRSDAMALIPRLREAGRLLDVLDMPGGKHSYESYFDAPESLMAEFETLKIWKRWVCGEPECIAAPIQSKNVFVGRDQK